MKKLSYKYALIYIIVHVSYYDLGWFNIWMWELLLDCGNAKICFSFEIFTVIKLFLLNFYYII